MVDLKSLFANPSAEYRTAPLWVWNSDMTHSEITKSLEELKTHGFGGAFVHPRPGMKINYMADCYFEAWGFALSEAKRLGMKLYIYDENSYPSGFGGGHVSSELPDCLSEAIRYQVVSEEELDRMNLDDMLWLENEVLVKAYACEKKDGKMVLCEDVTELPRAQWKGKGKLFAVMTHCESETAKWLAGFADIDRLRPEVTEMFLEKIYGAYAKHFGEDFGETIPAVFTDEPSLPGSTLYGNKSEGSLPVNHWFVYEFYKKKGYDILKYFPSLFEDWEGVENEKIRHDYYEVTQQLWAENFLMPIHEWCKAHNIAFTGHFMEDGWPKPYFVVVTPGVMSYYEHQDWPGIDLLKANRLRKEPSEPQEITLLEVMSAAHQFGKERVLCEAYGAGGYDSGLEDYKRIADYLFVNGVTFLNEHLTYTSYVGARKRDHPQSFDWRQAWWDDFTELNEYFARVTAVLSQGKAKERVLVLNPTMTGYIGARNEDVSNLIGNRLAKNPDMRPFLQMIQNLRSQQWDINLGDEIIMQRHAKVCEKQLQIVTQKYDVVILHECIRNVLPSTLELLKEFVAAGGTVLSVGRPGNFVAGVLKPQAYEELLQMEGCRIFTHQEDMLTYLNEHYTRYLYTDEVLPEGVESIRRVLEDDREVIFITNHSKKNVNTKIHFEGIELEEWNLWTGKTKKLESSEKEELCVPFALTDGESKMFCIKKQTTEKGRASVECAVHRCDVKSVQKNDEIEKVKDLSRTKETLIFDRIWQNTENVWPLEYCDLKIDGETYPDSSVYAAGCRIYKKRGFMRNPWDNEVQYKNRTYDRNRFYPENSGFTLTYHFKVAENFVPERLYLAVEYGERYEIRINDILVGEKEDDYFMDELICKYEIAGLVKSGANEIQLHVSKFDVELEAEPVTLVGEFGVFARDGVWEMDNAEELQMGSWDKQGYPFYSGSVIYEKQLVCQEKPKEALLYIPHSEAPSTSVTVNGKYAGTANVNGVHPVDIREFLEQGENCIQVKVASSMKNYLGPHFHTNGARGVASPGMWKHGAVSGHPKPEEYDLIKYGLVSEVKLVLR